MVFRLCSLFLSLTLLCACGKNIPQPPNTTHSKSALHGLWLPCSTEQSSMEQAPALTLSHDARIAFVYPTQEGHEQAQKVHHQIPLTWSAHGQNFSVTTVDVNASSTTLNSAMTTTEAFTYTLNMSDGQRVRLALKPTQSFENSESMIGHNYVQNDADMGMINGSLFYRERMMLPPDAVAIITLQEISRADAPAIILSSMAIGEANHTPLSFQIPYIKSDIIKGHRYSLRAYIMSQGELLFSTTSVYPVLRRGQATNPASVDMLLQRVHSQKEIQDSQHTSLQQTYWALQSLRGQAVMHFENQEDPHIVLASDGKTSGSDGCNRFFGGYTTHKNRITFLPGGTTMMLCPQGDKQAALFMSSLQEATGYNITDQTLELLRGKDVIARFTAKPMP